MKKVVSYSFFRHPNSEYESERCGESRGRFFVNYFRAIIPALKSCFPDWEIRVHYDNRVTEMSYWRALCRMETKGLLMLEPMGEAKTLCGSMLWRMKPLWDDSVDVVACRDLDSLPTIREYRTVEKFIEEDQYLIHGMNDSQSHASTKMMGGMVAFKAKQCRIRSTFEEFMQAAEIIGSGLNKKGDDQFVLNMLYMEMFKKLKLDKTKDMPHVDDRDLCDGHARHIGGAFHVEPVRQWYEKRYGEEEFMKTIRECEEGV